MGKNYKRFKHWVEIENFPGKSVLPVQQDLHAKIVTMNLTALMTLAAQRRVEKKPNRKHAYQVNFAQALSKMKHAVVVLIRGSVKTLRHLIAQTIGYFALTMLLALFTCNTIANAIKALKTQCIAITT